MTELQKLDVLEVSEM